MANTYTALYYHLVFSTKSRLPWIQPEMEQRIWEYLGGIARQNRMVALQVGGIEDHIHMAISAPPTLAPAKMAQLIKGGSSGWIHETFPGLRDFAWQDGYGAFTVSKSKMPDLTRYIVNQREHHRTMTYQVEYRGLLDRHEIEYDERYIGISVRDQASLRDARNRVTTFPWAKAHGYCRGLATRDKTAPCRSRPNSSPIAARSSPR